MSESLTQETAELITTLENIQDKRSRLLAKAPLDTAKDGDFFKLKTAYDELSKVLRGLKK